MEERYINRLLGSYNKKYACQFGKKKAADKFLNPWDLEITRHPPKSYGDNESRLNREEEVSLFRALHFMRYRLTKSEKSDFGRYLNIYLALRNRAVSSNWRLVPSCIARFTRNGKKYDQETLMSCGHEALISSVDKFDPWRGYRLSTYACNSIFRRCCREAKKKVHVFSMFPEMAEKMEDEEKLLWEEQLKSLLKNSNFLDEQEIQVLSRRFYDSCTLRQTGKHIGVSAERARQVQNNALRKLKRELHNMPSLNKDAVQYKLLDEFIRLSA